MRILVQIFFYSNNRGKKWEGPFDFPNFGTPGIAGRTDYFVDSKQEIVAFLTVAKSNLREGRVAYTRTEDRALNWELVSWVGPEPDLVTGLIPVPKLFI